MTISTSVKKNTYVGDAVTTEFAFTFPIDSQSNILVEFVTTTSGVTVTKALTSDYTVTGTGNTSGQTNYTSGTVTIVSTTATALQTVVIRRNMSLQQGSSYVENSVFPAKTTERALDELTMNDLQLQETIDRALFFPSSVTWTGALPVPSANKYLQFSADGSTLEANTGTTANLVDETTPTLGADLIAGAYQIKFASGSGINDANDNEVIKVVQTASAVNEISVTNAAAGNSPTVSSTGGDTDIGLAINAKGTGAVVVSASSLDVKYGATSQGIIKIFEDSDNGTNSISLTSAASLAADYTVTLPSATDTLVGLSTSDTLTNKTLVAPALGTPISGNLANCTGYPTAAVFNGMRNKIIGGDFATNPWQRGTSFTALASGSYGADRFVIANTTAAVVNILKTADAPTIAQAGMYTSSCLSADVTTADASIAAGDVYYIAQAIEGYNIAPAGFGQTGAKSITLSFWHKHTVTGTHCVGFRNSAGDRSYVAEYTQAVTDTWELATITVAGDTTGTWLYTNGFGLEVAFVVANGTTRQTTAGAWTAGNYVSSSNQVNNLSDTANFFKIALVQLEIGTSATAFEQRAVQDELALCQRYYYRVTPTGTYQRLGVGWNETTTQCASLIHFPVTMRTNVTAIEQSGSAGDYTVFHAATLTVCSAVPIYINGSNATILIRLTVASGLTAGQCSCATSTATAGYIGVSAEL